jgi:adenylate kinase
MLREEVEAQTPLGREVADIMSSGQLVSSAVVTALMRRRMRQHPGRRILLDGFPRSLENARDFVELCGPPELALHLDCDDCILLERILERGGRSAKEAERAKLEGNPNAAVSVSVRSDDNVHTAIQRLKNYHKHHKPTMDWLKSIKVPIVELDCSGTKEDVWQQLMAIGRLMRPAVKIPPVGVGQPVQQQQNQQQHSLQRQNQHQQEQVKDGELNGDLQWFA